MTQRPIPQAFAPPVAAAALLAVAAPSLLAHNVAPSATFWNQALALAGWALWLLLASGPGRPGAARAAAPVLAALALLAAAVGTAWVQGLPRGFAAGALGAMAAAALLLLAGARAGRAAAAAAPEGDALGPLRVVAWALLAAGLLNAAIASLQVFAPQWADGTWLARPGSAGRAIGNLRQPNHLASLLLWSAVALALLAQWRRVPVALAAGLMASLVLALVLTASRTGTLGVLALALWGALDRRLARPTRGLLLASPLLYLLAWGGMTAWAELGGGVFGGARRLQAGGDISSSRFAIWHDALALVAQQPWGGVGWGRFNLAWTLTPSPDRPTAFFDHTHNLPLQLAVELGLPLALAVLGLLAWGLARAARPRAALDAATDDGRRAALVAVLMIGLHSLLEYPLWYLHFLLPAAWLWGWALGAAAASVPPAAGPARAGPWRIGAVLMLLGTAWALTDYARVSTVFRPPPGAAPLAERIAAAQRGLFFSHHADYAAATTGTGLPDGAAGDATFARAAHHLLDTRLLTAWARHLHARGDADGARHLVQRLREFGRPETQRWLAECDAPEAAAAPPWHCVAPAAPRPWREFLAPR